MNTVAEQQTAVVPRQSNAPVRAGFFDLEGFELLQRVAKAFASSTLVPEAYRGNVPNCMIALNLASRLRADELMVMQNLYIVHGNPGWSSKFLIASVNTCGRFETLRYEWRGEEGADNYGCRAWTIEKSTGERLNGVWIDWKMVKAEGWSKKSGSKWLTMADQMFIYRSAAFWQRGYAPEISMGLSTAEELHDVIDVRADGTVSFGGYEEGGARAPAAEVVQPQSKSAKAAALPQADADGVIEQPTTQRQAEPVQREERSTQQAQQQPAQRTRAAAPTPAPRQREPGADDDDGFSGTPLSDSVLKILRTKMEQCAISDSDLKKKFGFDSSGVTKETYHAVVEFIENPS